MMSHKLSFSVTPKTEPHYYVSPIFFTSLFANYVRKIERKSERIFHERHRKHVYTDKDNIINNHLDECHGIKYLFSLLYLNSGLKASKDVQIHPFN